MKIFLLFPLILLGLIPSSNIDSALHDPCVMISFKNEAGSAYGSGVSFINSDTEFVWTAAHVIQGCEKIESVVDPQSGETKVIPSYSNVRIIKFLYNDLEKVGEKIVFAEVIRYSDCFNGYDLALLKTKSRITKTGIEFSESDLAIGSEVYSITSPSGPMGYNSYITGHLAANKRGVSQFGHETDSPSYNLHQYNLAIVGGSSGGGIFDLKTNKLVGIIVRANPKQSTMSWAVPTSLILKYAKEANCQWAVSKKNKIPDNIYLNNPRTSVIK